MLCVHAHVSVCEGHVYALALMWKSEDDFRESVLSFYPADPGDQTQVIGIGSKCLYPLRNYFFILRSMIQKFIFMCDGGRSQ